MAEIGNMEFPHLYRIMDQLGKDLVAELKKELISKGKDATGNLINSLGYHLIKTSDGYNIEITSADYLKYVDKGRRPGKMPPSNKLVPWVEARGIKFTGDGGEVLTSKSAAFVIAKSIGDKGIKPTNIIETSLRTIYLSRKDLIAQAAAKDYQEYIRKIFIV